jgi:hypothetical protein
VERVGASSATESQEGRLSAWTGIPPLLVRIEHNTTMTDRPVTGVDASVVAAP